MPAATATKSVEPETRSFLPQMSWADIETPGAYVEIGSGDLYRIPQEGLIKGSSPIVHKESHGASRLLRVSEDPFVTTLEARMLCAEHNVRPNF